MKHIELTDFSAYYKLKKEYAVALDAVSLQIEEGEFVTLMGPSGCGKTTLLKCILGQVDLTEGSLRLHGQEPTGDVIKKENVAYVAQDFSLYQHLNVYENIAFPLRIAELTPDEVDVRVRTIAEQCGLPAALLNRKPRQLSLGQQQRVALARAFIKEPKLILMDEPFSHLDAPLRREFQEWIRNYYLRTRATFLFVTHDEEEAQTLGGRILRMEDGVILSSEDTGACQKAAHREQKVQPIPTKSEHSKPSPKQRLLYRWPICLLGLVTLVFIVSTLWNQITKPDMNEKLSICFVGQNFNHEEAQSQLSQKPSPFTEQVLKELTVESLYHDNGTMLAEALTVRCIGETDFIILEDDYLFDQIGSRYFSEIPKDIAKLYFPDAETYEEDGRIYGIRVHSPDDGGESSAFSKYYKGENACWLFFTVVSENTAGMNGKGNTADTAALDLAAYLWREEP